MTDDDHRSGDQYCLWFECNPHPKWVYALDTLRFLAVNNAAVRKDGSIIHLILSSTPLEGKDLIKGVTFTALDITSRRQAEEALRQSEERFRATLYSIGDGVITTDANGAICQMNRVAEFLTDWREEEARGRPILEVFRIVDEETGEPIENPVQQVLQKGIVIGLADRAAFSS